MTRFRVCPIALALAALGTLSMLAGAFLDVDHPAFRFGLIAFLIGASAAIMSRTAATNGAIEAARQAGYDHGFREGREVARPVVIPFSPYRARAHAAASPRLDPAREQLAEAP